MQVLDTEDAPMPGVLLQERFTQKPSNFAVNVTGAGWHTRLAASTSYGLYCEGWPDHATSIAATRPNGGINAFDNLFYAWQLNTDIVAIHQYVAGSWHVEDTQQGIGIGTYTITFHRHGFYGSRGTVTHIQE
jgi:hypothetical protein